MYSQGSKPEVQTSSESKNKFSVRVDGQGYEVFVLTSFAAVYHENNTRPVAFVDTKSGAPVFNPPVDSPHKERLPKVFEQAYEGAQQSSEALPVVKETLAIIAGKHIPDSDSDLTKRFD